MLFFSSRCGVQQVIHHAESIERKYPIKRQPSTDWPIDSGLQAACTTTIVLVLIEKRKDRCRTTPQINSKSLIRGMFYSPHLAFFQHSPFWENSSLAGTISRREKKSLVPTRLENSMYMYCTVEYIPVCIAILPNPFEQLSRTEARDIFLA